MASKTIETFLSVLEARKSKAPTDSVSSEKPILGSRTADLSLCLHTVEGEKALSGVSFVRTLIPFMMSILMI